MYYPEKELGQLFKDVQLNRVFPDYKTFVDSTPNKTPAEILTLYEAQRNAPDFDLRSFVMAHFELPNMAERSGSKQAPSMEQHLREHWRKLIRHPQNTSAHSTLIPLPNPYIVPGGRFREMFYWDSFFTVIGLLESDEDDLALGMIQNFAFLIEQYGYIPNGNRSYFLGRSQPPFFAAILLAYGEKHGIEQVAEFSSHLEKEYWYWMDNQNDSVLHDTVGKHLVELDEGIHLNRYYGTEGAPRAEAFGKETRLANGMEGESRQEFFRNLRAVCESGWDFSSRWHAESQDKRSVRAMNIVPVDLNSLMYMTETALAELYRLKQDNTAAKLFESRANNRSAWIRRYLYDKKSGSFQDFDFINRRHTGCMTLAMVYPLFCGLASDSEAQQIENTVRTKFLKTGGLVTTLTESGEQWDFPNGWAPLQYIAVQGLLKYGYHTTALEIAERWINLNEKVFLEEGKMMEKYNVVDPNVKAGGGEYPNQDGFGWTNGVDLAFYRLLAK